MSDRNWIMCALRPLACAWSHDLSWTLLLEWWRQAGRQDGRQAGRQAASQAWRTLHCYWHNEVTCFTLSSSCWLSKRNSCEISYSNPRIVPGHLLLDAPVLPVLLLWFPACVSIWLFQIPDHLSLLSFSLWSPFISEEHPLYYQFY